MTRCPESIQSCTCRRFTTIFWMAAVLLFLRLSLHPGRTHAKVTGQKHILTPSISPNTTSRKVCTRIRWWPVAYTATAPCVHTAIQARPASWRVERRMGDGGARSKLAVMPRITPGLALSLLLLLARRCVDHVDQGPVRSSGRGCPYLITRPQARDCGSPALGRAVRWKRTSSASLPGHRS